MRLAGKRSPIWRRPPTPSGVLEKDGFKVNTVARFLLDEKMQAAAKGGRVVVDETSMLGHKDAVRLFKLARKIDLKLIFVGDPMQHGSVSRGALMRVLKDYGGIQPFRLTEIMRQEDPTTGRRQSCSPRAKRWRASTPSTAWAGSGRSARRGPLPADRGRLPASPGRQEDRPGRHPDARRSRPHHAGDPLELRQAGKLGAEERAFTRLVAVDVQRGRTRAGDHLPAGRRDPVPPERQGLHERRPADRHRSGDGAAGRGRRSSRSTGRRRSAWPRATASVSPAR